MSKVSTSYQLYRLTFTGPVHLGDDRPDDYAKSADFLHSDSLHAALLATMAKMGEPVPGLEGPGYTLSSCFPFGQDTSGKTIYFFPKPLLNFDLGKDEIDYAKKLKRVRWVDTEYLGHLLNGTPVDFGGSGQPNLQGIYLTSSTLPEKNPVATATTGQRVTVSREEKDAIPFISQRLFFSSKAGLFFLFDGDDAAKQRLESALHLLQNEGLGTDRSVGNGLFEFKHDNITLEHPKDASHAVNLSLFCPENAAQLSSMLDTEGAKTTYRVVRRGGWVTGADGRTLRKRSIGMLAEGSVLKTSDKQAGRKAINLGPLDENGQPLLPHPVWRNGQAIFLPCKPVN
ncbi:type III-A CRISPR-associated RAMP protein Csm4 [Neolewinella aurantiaca]|uniref:CRISPR system Cms protein Csm4 n=1 Tax=Neolewinella aurantiaca TaxID=2602767 RepID=A0A5C7FT97_9BACT|nr:type III-A CRISPR-associated RAMP protein Csm4 [Neolewinella aurantiaca]TXF87988.1 type III-A CRISPR-associated RAMP protein Csm4 [Neolewinella aurantiaca]